MTADEIRKMIRARDDWRALRDFDRRQSSPGLQPWFGWLALLTMKKQIPKTLAVTYFAALKLNNAVYRNLSDSIVVHWWKEYKGEYRAYLMSRDHRGAPRVR